MDIEYTYVYIMIGKKWSLLLANMDITYCAVYQEGGEGMGVKEVNLGKILLASYKFHFIRVHDNLV